MTAPARRRGGQLTVQGWLNVVLAVMGILVLAGAIAGAILMNRTDAVSGELIEEIQPSRVAAYRLQAAVRDQETAVRGYAIAADRQFLEPYYEGQQTEQEAAEEIRRHVGDHPNLIADLDAVEQATAEWRAAYAEPFIRGIDPGRPGVIDNDLVQRGKEGFDNIRALFHVQNVDLAAARTAGVKELDEVRAWRDRVLAGIIVTFFVTAALLAVLARSALVRPLSALAASCRRITEGHFDERIVARGPRDVQSMASDVEDMRQRIVEDLEASRAAQQQLDEQTVELRRSNAELEQFAYVASHDLQEPLRKVASFCQLLERRYGDKLDERGVEYIKFAVDGAKRMQVLINDLLTFSRVGRLSAAHTDVELDEVLDAALSNLETAIEESGAQIVRPEEPLPEVLGDPTLLAMLWQNLIGNAVKFRKPDTTPRIVIECQRGTDDRDGQWLFTVSDNGIGIPEEFSQKVFVIFQRLHGRDAYSGTGIGLALCKKIVEYHGGTIWIDNSYTEGTRFRITLPVAVHEQPEAVLEGAQ
ncbi:histidine kinase [Mycolicibacterium doricum]|uniref:histidine kinase n=1 Tax=Mycolicibacterium doricum TaxID=126673 RepID=A0A1X1TLP0_9MYCO|nr:ATP-binding protein [Mycolicibacterium doricum]MCV7269485.1 CHASE3 domain-containing protein [Mycolicibacterium doricum]ORV45443.1 histidine kinase [Mycolicibacterium doricum]BBZ07834.1 histidine kinase [Mycolicibacterium doricum]